MLRLKFALNRSRRRWVLLIAALTTIVVFGDGLSTGQESKGDILRIGTSGSLASDSEDRKKEEGALETMKAFLQEETGLKSEIVRQKDWRELADKLAKGQLDLGVFQGFEFAWAQEKYPDLKALAAAINNNPYAVVQVMVNKNDPAKDFAGLEGQTLALPTASRGYLNLYLDYLCKTQGKSPKDFFSKITSYDNVEDALDDVVDGVVKSTVVELTALDAFKRRKPGRFAKLKSIAQSPPLPPPVVAYYGKLLEAPARERFKEGVLGAHKKEKGETMLTLFRIARFETIGKDFEQVVAATQKMFPPPKTKSLKQN